MQGFKLILRTSILLKEPPEMFIAIVQIPGAKRSKEQAVEAGKASAPMYLGMTGLIRKYYLNGDEGGGGVYLWESREAAEAWYDDDWWPMMEKRFGVRPTLTYYDNHVIVDNASDELRIEGKAVALEQDAAQ
jgi:hypothetical protein|tara:strand:- start:147 stop:542 length:396 start_codon:yes stop_codon:yes gene_type:complete